MGSVSANDAAILEAFEEAPAPLLPLLHAFHDRDGYLSETSIRVVADALRIPLADLYGTVTFYDHFARFPPGKSAPRVCNGPVCMLNGAPAILDAMRKDGATPMPCAGRCDDPCPVILGDDVVVGTSATTLENRPTSLPIPNPGGIEECLFHAIRDPQRKTLDGYLATGGMTALERAAQLGTDALLETITDSKLAGRGGAGFPTGVKMRAVRDAACEVLRTTKYGAQKYVVCNADEGEPGCFKDRVLMDHDPFALIEGMAIAALATGATIGFIYLRYEYPQTLRVLEDAIAACAARGFLGSDVTGSGQAFHLHVRRGAGAYICGEETSLLNSLEGKHPFPRNKPPFPTTHGFDGMPTLVNNVETLCALPRIVVEGAAWYRGLGLGDHAGTKIISLSGDVAKPGNYEVPFGLPLKTLIEEWAGGVPNGRRVQAVTMAGLSGGFLAGDALDVTLDEASVRKHGSFLGAGGIMVFDDSRGMVEVARQAMDFFAHESCGKCFPCRIGTKRLTERLEGSAGPAAHADFVTELRDISEVMMSTSACGLGVAAPLVVTSLLQHFPDAVAQHVTSTRSGNDV
ncbi:MAG: NAD(P)H-dependent oxidoreductase subunit E [Planctomycetes bacterium]|nr:NAD(P)H-dependent oxidoreductase subunit E [Planctomycetota bacterium]MCB9891612.1 NAD(P)H-dependent oxidoreductase subunit E [Planctomycetota bacterium]MCB9917891.1 NAD(P)H-dependent oxidoreductase subunit E [Planctomycetota bacterium]